MTIQNTTININFNNSGPMSFGCGIHRPMLPPPSLFCGFSQPVVPFSSAPLFNCMPQMPVLPSLFSGINFFQAPVMPSFFGFQMPQFQQFTMPQFQFNQLPQLPAPGQFPSQLSFNSFSNAFKFNLNNTFMPFNGTVNPASPSVTPVANNNSQNFSAMNLSDKQLTEYGFDTPEKRQGFRSLKPEMQHAVVKLTDYAKSEGIKITYKSKRSIFRTRADQEAIYKTTRPGFAAKPGSSRHETGEAVDITIPGANSNNKNDPQYKKLAAFWQNMGYTWGGNWNHCEPWHFDLRKA